MDRDAAIVEPERRHPVGGVRGKVRFDVRGARCARVPHHRLRELAAVERVAIRLRDAFERRGHRGTGEALAGIRRAPVRREMLEPSKVARHVRKRERPFLRDDRRHEMAVARVADRGLEEVGERQFTEALRQRAPPGNRAGYRHRLPAALVHRGTTREASRIPRGGRPAGRVEPDEFAARPHEREQIGAEAVAAGLDDRQRDRGRQRGVDGVAALGEHRDARLRREGLRRRDRVAREDRLPARRVGKVPVEGHRRARAGSRAMRRAATAAAAHGTCGATRVRLPGRLPRASCGCSARR